MDGQPKISVIVPYFRHKQNIENCLEFITNQTLKEIEIIVVNDSSDNDIDIVRKLSTKDRRIKIIDSTQNNGVGIAMNLGLDMARGEYVQFLDRDFSYYYPNLLENSFNEAVESDADICIFKSEIEFSKSNTVVIDWGIDEDILSKCKLFTIHGLVGNVFSAIRGYCIDKIFRREYLISNNLKFSENFKKYDPFFTYLALISTCKITALNKVLIRNIKNKNDVIEEKFTELFFNWYDLKLFLESKGLFHNDVKADFLQEILNLLFGNIFEYMAPSDEVSDFFDFLLNEGFEKLGFIGFNDSIENNQDLRCYLLYRRMLKYRIGEYLKFKKSLELDPIKSYNMIPVLFCSDENGAFPLSVSMASLLENANKSTFYCIYIFTPEDFDCIKKDKLISLLDVYKNCTIKFITIDKALFSDAEIKTQHLTFVAFYRLLAAKYLRNVKKIIYLDIDTVVRHDLKELYDIDINDYFVAGVKAPAFMVSPDWAKSKSEELGIPSMEQYINSGVSFYNLQKIRENNLVNRFLELYKNNYRSEDQDVINAACFNHIKHLPFKFNAMTKYLNSESPYHWKGKKVFSDEEWEIANNNPAIIHYADKSKPWRDFEIYKSEEWLRYIEKSPLFNEKDYSYYPNYIKYKNTLCKL